MYTAENSLSPFLATLPDKLRVLPVSGRSCPPVTPFTATDPQSSSVTPLFATHPKNRGVGVKLLTSAGPSGRGFRETWTAPSIEYNYIRPSGRSAHPYLIYYREAVRGTQRRHSAQCAEE